MGRVTTRVAASTGRKRVPNTERTPSTIALPCKSSVIKITEVSESNKIARRRVKVLTATDLGLLLVESW